MGSLHSFYPDVQAIRCVVLFWQSDAGLLILHLMLSSLLKIIRQSLSYLETEPAEVIGLLLSRAKKSNKA